MAVDDPTRPATERIHDKMYPGISRRRLLSSLVGVGFTKATASYLTESDIRASASDQVPIVVGHYSDDPHGDRSHETTYVPADWYNDFRHATRMKARLADRIGHKPGIVSVGVVPGKIGGDNSRVIVRKKNGLGAASNQIPDEIEGVPVNLETVEGFQPATTVGQPAIDEARKSGWEFGTASEYQASGCSAQLRNWNSSYSSIYGGYAVKGDSNTPTGTVGGAAFRNGNRYLVCSHHIFSGSNANGKTVRHPDGTRLGTVKRSKCKEDFAMVSLSSDYTIQRDISYSGYSGVTGHYTYDGLSNLMSRGANTYKVGRTTCRTSFSKITSIADTIFTAPGCIPKPYAVFHKGANGQKGGDSGAISFHQSPRNSRNCWLISLMNYIDSATSSVFGTGIYRLADFGYGF